MSVPTIHKSAPYPRILGVLTAVLGATGVGLGAFGAHALKMRLESTGHLETWHTAVFYQMIHATAALAVWVLLSGSRDEARPMLLAAIRCWLSGILLFSGSLYGLSLDGPRWLGPVTPLGGLLLIAGWICVGAAVLRAQPAAASQSDAN